MTYKWVFDPFQRLDIYLFTIATRSILGLPNLLFCRYCELFVLW